MTKAFGRDINKFYNFNFPADHYTDEEADWIDEYTNSEGLLCLPDDQKFELSDFGVVISEATEQARLFSSVFKRWQKQQTTTTIAIEVKTEDREGAILRLKEMGFKIVK